MIPATIHTLPPTRASAGSSSSIRDEIERGLKGTEELTVPGSRGEDRKWAFKRSVPTLVLYDEEGLRLYDEITAHAHEYYLFEDEMNLLKEHGLEIALAMGFPGRQRRQEDKHEDKEQDTARRPVEKPWKPARWGDTAVGRWNGGVNGEEGLGSGVESGWDVVELGAGALRKTAYLLKALCSSLPSDTSSNPPPITYHPLDLSRPELSRVLGEMDEAFGSELAGKVACVGLHGDYEAGLQFIRDGKLDSLRTSAEAESRGRGLEYESASSREQSLNPSLAQPIPQISVRDKRSGDSTTSSPVSVHLITPGTQASPLPSAIPDSEVSDLSASGTDSGSGTWSPVSEEDPQMTKPYLAPKTYKNDSSAVNPHNSAQSSRPLHLVFLGSSLGNFDRGDAAPFLKSLPLRKGDTLLLGLDGRPAPGAEGSRMVEVAYNDPSGYTRAFEEHGWDVVRKELGLEGDAGVEFVGRYNEELGRHEAYFRSKSKQTIELPNSRQDVTLEEDELLNIEWSYKYSLQEATELFQEADLRVVDSWKAPGSEYRLWLLERPSVRFIAPLVEAEGMSISHKSSEGKTASKWEMIKGVPKWEEWLSLWKLWDHITLDMIPKELLHQKPIDLRHICLFYLGHIPTFLDIHLTRMTKGYHTEPEYFKTIFERGIDPDVDDPTKCHDHSEVPMSEEDWPALGEILGFRDRVRARLRGIYDKLSNGQMAFSRHVGRVIFMTFEHEAMHAETLLYMLIQSPLTRPPSAASTPQWETVAKHWKAFATINKVLDVTGREVKMGHWDLEEEDEQYSDAEGWSDHEFGWDNEHPQVFKQVKPFKIDSLPISNNEYMQYLKAVELFDTIDCESAPASWVRDEGEPEWKIRTLYGPLSFEVAGTWPLMASKNEIEAFAKWKGGRLPTEEELRALWETEEGPRVMGEMDNVGVKNWHPVPPTNTNRDNAGKVIHGHNGGVWEWTDTEFKGYEGFVTSELYPGYSSDFFDGKHFVVLGGSFATVPGIAGRKSFRNWYQASYRFSFIGGRVAYDV